MVEFCPECSGLLKKIKMNDKSLLICRCGYQKEIENREEKIKIEIQKKKDALKKKLLLLPLTPRYQFFPELLKSVLNVKIERQKLGKSKREALTSQALLFSGV